MTRSIVEANGFTSSATPDFERSVTA